MEKRLPLPVGTLLQGRYRIVRQLGHGGFGAVYEAVDDEINLTLAIKETFYAADEGFRQAFKREARLLASLSHEAFPRVSHYFTENEGCFLVMELIPGDDLDKLLGNRAGPFEPEQVLIWADQILEALENLHTGGVIHRDIKPSNLKLTPKGKIKLLDFGIAKGTLQGETAVMTTVGSMAAATMQYAPLEQVLRASQQHQMMLSVVSSDRVIEIMKYGTDATSDLYALAATLYQLLTKTLPADSPTRALAIWSGQADRLIPAHNVNPQVSANVSDILQKALSLDQRARLATASEMRQMLRAAVNSVTPIVANPANPVGIGPVIDSASINPESIANKAAGPGTQPFSGYIQGTNPSPQQFNNEVATEITPVASLADKSKTAANSRNIYVWLIGLPMLFIALISLVIIGRVIYVIANNPGDPNSNNINSTAGNKYKLAQTLRGHKGQVLWAGFSPDGRLIASADSEGVLKIWDAPSGLIKQTIEGVYYPFSSDLAYPEAVAFSSDGRYLSYLSGDANSHSLVIRQMSSGSVVSLTPATTSKFCSIKFSPDSSYIYYVQILDEKNLANVILQMPILGGTAKTIQHFKGVFMTLSPDGQTMAYGDNKMIKLLDTNSLVLKGGIGAEKEGDVISFITFSPDDKTIASGGGGGSGINVWDIATGNLIVNLAETNRVDAISFSPDNHTIASVSYSKVIQVSDIFSKGRIQKLEGHDGNVKSIAYSPNGKAIISASDDGTVKIWRVE